MKNHNKKPLKPPSLSILLGMEENMQTGLSQRLTDQVKSSILK